MKLSLPFPASLLTPDPVERRIIRRLARCPREEPINLWLTFSSPWRVVLYGITRMIGYALALILGAIAMYGLTVLAFCF